MQLGSIARGRHQQPGGRHSIYSRLIGIQQSTSINPPISMPDALPAATLSIYSGLGQAREYAGLLGLVHTPVAWFCISHNEMAIWQ